MIFAEAGIRPGMRVLDLGCGAGDATFVAADLVGPGGSVVGLDHSPEALARACLEPDGAAWPRWSSSRPTSTTRRRAGRSTRSSSGLALWRDPDTAAVLRRQATALRPGGLVVPIEPDVSPIYEEPEITC